MGGGLLIFQDLKYVLLLGNNDFCFLDNSLHLESVLVVHELHIVHLDF